MICTIPPDKLVNKFLVVHISEDMSVSGAISLFGNPQIHDKIQMSISMLERCHKQLLYFCNELDKYLNTEQ